MFGLVLAIGIVVDDAIVVVEAAQRNIDDGMAPRDAAIRAMEEVSAPVVAIACILAAVFVPVAFVGGISGRIYNQFALTIAISVLLSAFSALSLSPALSAMILRPEKRSATDCWAASFRDSIWDSTGSGTDILSGVHSLIRKSAFALIGLLCFWIFAGALFHHLPTGFLPDEDQGTILASIRLPDGASVERADAATRKIEQIVSSIPGVAGTMTMGGVDITTRTNSSNAATLVIRLNPWDERQSEDLDLQSILARMQIRILPKFRKATVSAFGQPPIQGLSITGGFQLMLEDRLGGSLQDFSQVADLLVQAARKRPELTNVSSTFHANVPSYNIDVDLRQGADSGDSGHGNL